MHSSSPLKERGVTACPSHSPIKPSIELGRSVISVTKRCLEKEIFKLSSSPPLEGARLSVYCKLVLIGLFSAWIVYELLFVEYDVEDFIMFMFSLLSVPALLLLSNGLNQGFFLLVIYLAVGIYLNVKKKRLGWS